MGLFLQAVFTNLTGTTAHEWDVGSARQLMAQLLDTLVGEGEKRDEWTTVSSISVRVEDGKGSGWWKSLATNFNNSWSLFIDDKQLEDFEYVDQLCGEVWYRARKEVDNQNGASPGTPTVTDESGRERPMTREAL